ncbi:MAG: hypothetical protein M3209_00835 [Acidobacteriota bacterium]|nr:hypothetical protein [Acidobacteriota bacterium]
MNGFPVENQNQINEAKFLALALEEFPILADVFAEENGLFHLQMAAFSHLAQDAIERGDFATLKRCYNLADETMQSATPSIENVIYVSFLENLDFESSPCGKQAENLLPPKLKEMLAELNEHWQQIGEWQVAQQEAYENEARKK